MTPIEFFKEFSKIPHGSGNEEAIAKYIENIAKKHGLYCYRDNLNNVYVRKNASEGLEAYPPVLFAAHTDMVCEKIPTSNHNFLTDGIVLIEKNGFLYANGTTLGGDDGAGVAIMLSLMTNEHLIAPVTEYLFTTCEETGMDGAIGFDYSGVLSDMVINLDSGNEKGVCISCASGYRYDLKIPVERTRKCGKAFKLTVCGLAGGHSGVEIDSARHSAVSLLGALLDRIYSEYPFHLAEIICNGKANVIAPSASATLFFYDRADEERAKNTASIFEKEIRSVLCDADAKKFRINLKKLSAKDTEALPNIFTLKSTSCVISALMLCPQGVIKRFSSDNSVLSSINLGIIKTEADAVHFTFLARSASAICDALTRQKLKRIAHVLCAELIEGSNHGCWEYKRGTPLQDAYEKACETALGFKPSFFATHAGLECGTFYEKLKALGKEPDIISIGPNMHDIHTPKESLDIASVNRVYKALNELLKIICEKKQ